MLLRKEGLNHNAHYVAICITCMQEDYCPLWISNILEYKRKTEIFKSERMETIATDDC